MTISRNAFPVIDKLQMKIGEYASTYDNRNKLKKLLT